MANEQQLENFKNSEETFEVVDKRPGLYFTHNDLIDIYGEKLGPIGIALYGAYCRYSNLKTNECWPSRKLLAKKLKVSDTTIDTYNRLLISLKLVKIVSGKIEGKSNTIEVLVPQGNKELVTGVTKSLLPGNNVLVTNNTNITSNNLSKDKLLNKVPTKQLILYYYEYLERIKNIKLRPNWEIDGRQVKSFLKQFSLQDYKDFINWFFETNNFQPSYPALQNCLSTFMVNKWQVEKISYSGSAVSFNSVSKGDG